MADKKVWLITGAGRGLGLDIAKAALAAGHAVVATGRDPAKVTAAIGHHDDLLAIKLDVTRLEDAQAAVTATVTKFDRIDVLVNNAGASYTGTNDAKFYDLEGNMFAEATGTAVAKRISPP
jgi:NAD(P)-dependent dehydrogenase (short-subunit alcohol dehydrogenase family)